MEQREFPGMFVDLPLFGHSPCPFAWDKIHRGRIRDRFASLLVHLGEGCKSFQNRIIGTRRVELERPQHQRSELAHVRIAMVQNTEEGRGFTFIELIRQIHQGTNTLFGHLLEDVFTHLRFWHTWIEQDLGHFFEEPRTLLMRLLLPGTGRS